MMENNSGIFRYIQGEFHESLPNSGRENALGRQNRTFPTKTGELAFYYRIG